MINIDGIYETRTYDGVTGTTDVDGNRFITYICYGNRMLAKVYGIGDNNDDGSILYIDKNGQYRKYKVLGYYNNNALVGFILGVLYNGERESNQSGNIPDVPNEVQVGTNA